VSALSAASARAILGHSIDVDAVDQFVSRIQVHDFLSGGGNVRAIEIREVRSGDGA
jgi:hypothetical protein